MMIRRRAFLLGTGLVAAAPLLAKVPIRSIIEESSSPEALLEAQVTHEANANDLLMKIEGWTDHDDVASSTIDSALRRSAPDGVWLVINRSWRTAWL